VRAWQDYDKRVKERMDKSRGLSALKDAYREGEDETLDNRRMPTQRWEYEG
jgi:hypothetical protein